MSDSLEFVRALRQATTAYYRDEIKRAEQQIARGIYLRDYWTKALVAADNLRLEMDIVVEPSTPATADSLPRLTESL